MPQSKKSRSKTKPTDLKPLAFVKRKDFHLAAYTLSWLKQSVNEGRTPPPQLVKVLLDLVSVNKGIKEEVNRRSKIAIKTLSELSFGNLSITVSLPQESSFTPPPRKNITDQPNTQDKKSPKKEKVVFTAKEFVSRFFGFLHLWDEDDFINLIKDKSALISAAKKYLSSYLGQIPARKQPKVNTKHVWIAIIAVAFDHAHTEETYENKGLTHVNYAAYLASSVAKIYQKIA